MFGGKEKTKDMEAPVINKSTSKDIKTLIGEGCKVEGNFYIPTFTRIDGTVKGDLTGESGIIIGIQGRVIGNICASEVAIYGIVDGNIEAQKLELKKGSAINGDISVTHLITELGSMFNGRCSMNENVHTEPANVPEIAETNAA
ncbi:MAG: polymer-forming cytoskeletal protein [Ignavibacteria bacterium]|jgi:cytoskeletal protein CcmA (bactofilin family)